MALVETLAHEATVKTARKGEFSIVVKATVARNGSRMLRVTVSSEPGIVLPFRPFTHDVYFSARQLTDEERRGISREDWQAIDRMTKALRYALSEQREYKHVCVEGECEDCRQEKVK